MDRFKELLRFALVGGFNAGTYFGLFSVGVLVGVPFLLASAIAFVLSASLGYWLHEHWTFKGRSPSWSGLAAWIAAQGAGILLNMGLLALLVHAFDLGPIVAQLILMPVPPVATYLIGRRWVFTQAQTPVD